MTSGEGDALDVLRELDLSDTKSVTKKRFRFLGIYSGTIGSTKLAEVALGRCWHAEVVREATEKSHRVRWNSTRRSRTLITMIFFLSVDLGGLSGAMEMEMRLIDFLCDSE